MTKKTCFVMGLAVVLGLLCLAGSANANIAGVAVVDMYSQNGNTMQFATSIVNGSGLSGGMHNTNNFAMWLSSDQTYGQVSSQYLVFDLGGTYNLTSTHIWNYNETPAWAPAQLPLNYFPYYAQSRGVYQMDVLVSADNTTWTNLGTKTLTAATGLDTYTGEDIALSATGVRYVRFSILTNQSANTAGWTMPGSPPSEGYVGLSEVQFTPEPATMVLFGLGSLLLRRRKSC